MLPHPMKNLFSDESTSSSGWGRVYITSSQHAAAEDNSVLSADLGPGRCQGKWGREPYISGLPYIFRVQIWYIEKRYAKMALCKVRYILNIDHLQINRHHLNTMQCTWASYKILIVENLKYQFMVRYDLVVIQAPWFCSSCYTSYSLSLF